MSCDEGMGFELGPADLFEDPMFTVGDGIDYYARRPQPVLPVELRHLGDQRGPDALTCATVLDGPAAGTQDETIRRAIEIRDGVVQNPKILSFQDRSAEYPHPVR